MREITESHMKDDSTNSGIVETVEEILSRVEPSLGGATIKLRQIEGGTVIVDFYRARTDSSCHANRTRTTEELVVEILEEDLRAAVPGFEKVIVADPGAGL